MNSRFPSSSSKIEQSANQKHLTKSIRKNNNSLNLMYEESNYSQSQSKALQSQKQVMQDSQLDLIYLREILDYLLKMKLYPLADVIQDVKDLRQQLKSSKIQASFLLLPLIQSIDPYLDIKSFQDERLVHLIKKFGYTVRLSKTRLMSLGSAHAYLPNIKFITHRLTQTLHLLKWLQTLGEFINTCQHSDELTDETIEDVIERAILREYRDNTFNSGVIKTLVQNQQIQLNVRIQDVKAQKQCLLDHITMEKSLQPKMQPLEDEIMMLERQRVDFEQQMQHTEQDINQVAQEDLQIIRKIQDQSQEIAALKQNIEALKTQVDTQQMSQQQANELIQKTNHNNFQLKKYLEEVQKLQNSNKDLQTTIIESQQNIEMNVFEFNNILENDSEMQQRLQPLPIKFNIFDRIPLQVQLKETQNGVEDMIQDELLMSNDFDYQEMEIIQKIIEDKQLNQITTKRTKSVQIYDYIIKRDVKQTFNLMLPKCTRSAIKTTFLGQLKLHQQTMECNEAKIAELQDLIHTQEQQEKSLTQEKARLEQTYQTLTQREQQQDNLKVLYAEYDAKYQALIAEKVTLEKQHTKCKEELCFESDELERLQEQFDAEQECYAQKIQNCERIEIQAQSQMDNLQNHTQSLLLAMQSKIMALNEQYNYNFQ